MNQTNARKTDQIPDVILNRKILGMSAILLPVTSTGDVDWLGLQAHVKRTVAAGLIPAINMDTGYANLIANDTRRKVLEETRAIVDGGQFVSGVFVEDNPDSVFDMTAYRKGIDEVTEYGGTPIIFQSYGLTSQADDEIVQSYERIGQHAGDFLAFELGDMFAPFGKIYSLDVYAGLMSVKSCVGAKHSSLRRDLEWQRIEMRNLNRPDFKVLTGNDLAIDMVVYGSDYLLGLSTFAPDAFAKRDAMWLEGDSGFYELNDLLQYLGFFAFRSPVPAYKHNAAQFLNARGWIKNSATYKGSPQRPESDITVLRDVLARLEAYLA